MKPLKAFYMTARVIQVCLCGRGTNSRGSWGLRHPTFLGVPSLFPPAAPVFTAPVFPVSRSPSHAPATHCHPPLPCLWCSSAPVVMSCCVAVSWHWALTEWGPSWCRCCVGYNHGSECLQMTQLGQLLTLPPKLWSHYLAYSYRNWLQSQMWFLTLNRSINALVWFETVKHFH